ncbi:hypothetical protein OE88DRAFT_1667809 [Heliocybe sulcata]|uniref:Uncharacterized protein n=1 Tax=Heliocybe sulcata TaxID=5364 RepID=A0A5C3MLY6_9AGAM|nr:hypothetical protein OE88DRAFT_1667809 [Heliocybe sulcata]
MVVIARTLHDMSRNIPMDLARQYEIAKLMKLSFRSSCLLYHTQRKRLPDNTTSQSPEDFFPAGTDPTKKPSSPAPA